MPEKFEEKEKEEGLPGHFEFELNAPPGASPDEFRVIEEPADLVQRAAAERGWEESDVYDIAICFREPIINGLKYGAPKTPEGATNTVQVTVDVWADKIEIFVRDYGKGFDWRNVKDPRAKDALDETHGRGIFFMRRFTDEVRYNAAGNEVTLGKRRRTGVLPPGATPDGFLSPEIHEQGYDVVDTADGFHAWRSKEPEPD